MHVGIPGSCRRQSQSEIGCHCCLFILILVLEMQHLQPRCALKIGGGFLSDPSKVRSIYSHSSAARPTASESLFFAGLIYGSKPRHAARRVESAGEALRYLLSAVAQVDRTT